MKYFINISLLFLLVSNQAINYFAFEVPASGTFKLNSRWTNNAAGPI